VLPAGLPLVQRRVYALVYLLKQNQLLLPQYPARGKLAVLRALVDADLLVRVEGRAVG
jgi:hypothetical protein